jgi:excisionase family DNA binding protein
MADIATENRSAQEKRHLRLREAAEWYGVSERTLRRRIAEGRLPAFRVGPKSIRVRSEDVESLAVPIPAAVQSEAS